MQQLISRLELFIKPNDLFCLLQISCLFLQHDLVVFRCLVLPRRSLDTHDTRSRKRLMYNDCGTLFVTFLIQFFAAFFGHKKQRNTA